MSAGTARLRRLHDEIRACRLCAAALPLGPNPVLRAEHPGARILLIGQAPGRKVHESGVPWNDVSGERLRAWLGVTKDDFYDQSKFAIMPMGFCYPGTGRGGDLPPRPECAPQWHAAVRRLLPEIQLTLLVGQYAQAFYLPGPRKASLAETVRGWRAYAGAGLWPLVHPSPRNQRWLKQNPWFEREVLPQLRKRVAALIGGNR